MTTKLKSPKDGKEEVQEQKQTEEPKEVKYEFVLSQEDIQALDNFIQPSFGALRVGTLDAGAAFTKLVELLRSKLKTREL